MKITIITTVFNAKEDIRRTIESVLSAEEVDLEYIITDGGSNDGTLDVIADYPEVQVYSEPDKGIYDGMNKGIRKATGEVIGLLNAADEYTPTALAVVAAAAEENPECGVFHGRMQWVVDGQVMSETGQAVSVKPKRHLMPVCHPTTFIRREVYEKYGLFDDSYKIAADHKLIHYLHTEGVKFQFIDQVLARMEGGGASGQHRKVKSEEVLRTMKEYEVSAKDRLKVKLGYYLFTLKDLAKKVRVLRHPLVKKLFWKVSKFVK